MWKINMLWERNSLQWGKGAAMSWGKVKGKNSAAKCNELCGVH